MSNVSSGYASGSQTARTTTRRAGAQQPVLRYANQMSDDNPFTPPSYSDRQNGNGHASGAVTQRSGVHYYPAVPFDRDIQRRVDQPLIRHMEYIANGGVPLSNASMTRAFIESHYNDNDDNDAPPTAILAATLPLLGNWSAQRATGDDYPLYGYQSKYQY
jgi:hypothetical protein